MQAFPDFIQENLDLTPDADWQRLYFARFRFLRSKADLPPFLQELQQVNAASYHGQEIGPKSCAYLHFIWNVLDVCAQTQDCDFSVIAYLCGSLVQGMLTEEMARGFEAAFKADREYQQQNPTLLARLREHSPGSIIAPIEEQAPLQRAELQEMPLRLMQALLQKQAMTAIRQLIIRLYTAYQAPLRLLVSESSSEEAWLRHVCDIIPLLLLKNFVPLQDRMLAPAPLNIYMSADLSQAPRLEEETSYPLSPLFQQLFSDEEIKEFQVMDQHIIETFANLFPLTYINRPRLFALVRADVQRVAQQEGREAALKQAASYYQARFYIPRYFYEQLRAESDGPRQTGAVQTAAGDPTQTAALHTPDHHGFNLQEKIAEAGTGLRRFLHLDADDKK